MILKKAKYNFNHFVIKDGTRVEIDPTVIEEVSSQCKLLWVNLATGKEHTLEEQGKK